METIRFDREVADLERVVAEIKKEKRPDLQTSYLWAKEQGRIAYLEQVISNLDKEAGNIEYKLIEVEESNGTKKDN